MKKLLQIFGAALLTALSVSVFAQGTGVRPGVGSEHVYSVTANATSTFSWNVTSDPQGTTTVIGSVASFVSGENTNSVKIRWDNPTIGNTYYVHVLETVDSTGCVNRKALAVAPENLFELEIENFAYVEDKDTGAVYEICPADVLIASYNGSNDGSLADAQNFTYNYQKDSLFYRIYPIGINTDNIAWNAEISVTNSAGTQSLYYSTDNSTYTAVPGTGIIPVGVGNSEVFVKVVIDNSTTNEGTSKNDVTTTLKSGTDGNSNSAISLGNESRLQTVKARPATSDIITTE